MVSVNRVPYAVGDDGHPDTTTVYLRCPDCTVLAVPLGLTYAPGDTGGISPDHPIEATCGACATDFATTTAALAPRDVDRVCARCRLAFAVPAVADEVICPGCGIHQPGPATLIDPWRAAAVDRILTRRLSVVHARLRALHHLSAEEPADKLPCYTDDPLVDRAAHRLTIHHDPGASTRDGQRLQFGVCSCGEWVTPSWDISAVFEAYDQHMTEIQATVHEQAGRAAR